VAPALSGVLLGATWALVVAHLLFSRTHERCGEFAMGLPIPARRLWLLRTGLLAGTSVLLIASVAALPVSKGRVAASVFLNLAACVLLAVVWIESWVPRKNTMSGWGFWLFSAVGLAGAIWLSWWLAWTSAWAALVPLGSALALGARTWLAVPLGFELDRSAGAPVEEAAPRAAAPWAGRLLVPRLVYEWYWWAMFVMFFMVGMLPASEEAGPIVVFALATSLAPVTLKLPQVAHLPISRRRLFAWGTLPAVVCFLGGLWAGRLVHGARGLRSWLVVYEPGGPETLRWVQLRVDLHLGAVLAVVAGLAWLAIVMLQVAKLGVPALTRWVAWRRRVVLWSGLAGCLLLMPVAALLMVDPSEFGKPAEALAYYLALGLARMAGVFPTGWSAVVAAAAALIGMYGWGERRFRQAEALAPMSGLL
jgi:hypothetical protein